MGPHQVYVPYFLLFCISPFYVLNVFRRAELLVLRKSHLLIFSFTVRAYLDYLRKICLFHTTILSRGFVDIGFTLRFVTHFRYIFVNGLVLKVVLFFSIWISNCFNTVC